MRVIFIKDYTDQEEMIFVEAGDTGTLIDETTCLIKLDDQDETLEFVNQGCFVLAEEDSVFGEKEEEEVKMGGVLELALGYMRGEKLSNPFDEK